MAKISSKDLLIGAALSYISCVVSFGAYISTTVGHGGVTFASTLLAAAAIPAAAHCCGSMVAGGGAATRACALLSLHAALNSVFVFNFGFLAALSCSTLAAAVVFTGKLVDGRDDRFHVVKSAAGGFFKAFLRALWWDFGSAVCFLLVVAITGMVYFSDLEQRRHDDAAEEILHRQ